MNEVKRYLLTNLNDPYWVDRNYSIDVWKNAINKLSASSKPILGELGDELPPTVNLAWISHRITNLLLEDDNCIYGDVEILKTPSGIKAKYYLEKDICKFRIRAMGGQNDVDIITWDIVSK
jgi:hypothetical protein